jgi:hypothetical protein
MERPAPEDEQTLAVLEAAIAEPVGIQSARVGWDALAIVASERGCDHVLKRIESLRSEHPLGPAFPWSVRAERAGVIFTRREAAS